MLGLSPRLTSILVSKFGQIILLLVIIIPVIIRYKYSRNRSVTKLQFLTLVCSAYGSLFFLYSIGYFVWQEPSKREGSPYPNSPSPSHIREAPFGFYDKISDRIQQDIYSLQFPENCGTQRKKVHCDLTFKNMQDCGFACSIQHIVYCLIVALATNRTLVLDDEHFRYTGEAGIKRFFNPVHSEDCDTRASRSLKPHDKYCLRENKILSPECKDPEHMKVSWPQVLRYTMCERVHFLPGRMPSYLKPLQEYHPHPLAWWAGQLFKYVMRYNSDTMAFLEKRDRALNFSAGTGPIVGIHVRRTDKVALFSEAGSHTIDEYMKFTEKYFEKRGNVKKRIYLASDDPTVLEELVRKYGGPNGYEIMSNPRGAKVSYNLDMRESVDGSYGVLMDLHFLSLVDHLVCTLSSNFCRLAYNLRNTKLPDTFQDSHVDSLDYKYFMFFYQVTNIKQDDLFINFTDYSHTANTK